MRLLKWTNDFALIIVWLDQMHVSSQKIIHSTSLTEALLNMKWLLAKPFIKYVVILALALPTLMPCRTTFCSSKSKQKITTKAMVNRKRHNGSPLWRPLCGWKEPDLDEKVARRTSIGKREIKNNSNALHWSIQLDH